jgi:hypothetical protein
MSSDYSFGKVSRDQSFNNLNVRKTLGQCGTEVKAKCIVAGSITVDSLLVTGEVIEPLPTIIPLSYFRTGWLAGNAPVGGQQNIPGTGGSFVINSTVAGVTDPSAIDSPPDASLVVNEVTGTSIEISGSALSVNTSGLYDIAWEIIFDNGPAGSVGGFIVINDTGTGLRNLSSSRLGNMASGDAAGDWILASGSGTLLLNVGDTITLAVGHEGGGVEGLLQALLTVTQRSA